MGECKLFVKIKFKKIRNYFFKNKLKNCSTILISASFYALSRNGDPCDCSIGLGVVTFRPDIGDGNWGGFDDITCRADSQMLEFHFVDNG